MARNMKGYVYKFIRENTFKIHELIQSNKHTKDSVDYFEDIEDKLELHLANEMTNYDSFYYNTKVYYLETALNNKLIVTLNKGIAFIKLESSIKYRKL